MPSALPVAPREHDHLVGDRWRICELPANGRPLARAQPAPTRILTATARDPGLRHALEANFVSTPVLQQETAGIHLLDGSAELPSLARGGTREQQNEGDRTEDTNSRTRNWPNLLRCQRFELCGSGFRHEPFLPKAHVHRPIGIASIAGAGGGTRTHMALRPGPFEGPAYTDFATPAGCTRRYHAYRQAPRKSGSRLSPAPRSG